MGWLAAIKAGWSGLMLALQYLRGQQEAKTREWEAGHDAAENEQLRAIREAEGDAAGVRRHTSGELDERLRSGGFGGQDPSDSA